MTMHQGDLDETYECLFLPPQWISHVGAHRPGESIALDHVLPRAVVPELSARFYNLEAIASKANLAKSAKIGQRELDLARRWQREGLLSAAGLAAVEAAAR